MQAHELAEMVGKYHQVRQSRLEADRQAKALAKEEAALKEALIVNMQQEDIPVVGGSGLTVTLVKKLKPRAADWPAIYAYIREHDAFELLHRRLTDTAIKERWEEGENIPGVVEVEIPDLSLSTVRRT